MAEPVGPEFDRALSKDPSPAAWEEGIHESAVHSSSGKNVTGLAGNQDTTGPATGGAASPPSPAPGSRSPAQQESDARKQAAVSMTPPPGEPPAKGNFSSLETVADLWSRVADVDPIMYYWEEPADARGRGAEESPDESSPHFLGRRSLYKRSDPPPSAEEELANVISFLQKLRTTVRRVEPRSEALSPAAAGLSILQSKRLTRTGVTPDHFQIGALPRAWSTPRIEAHPEPVMEKPAPPQEVPPAARPVRLERRRAAWPVLTGGLSLVILCLVAFLWTRAGFPARVDVAPGSTEQRGRPTRAQEVQPPEEVLNLANLALEAIQRGDLKKASGLLDKAQKQGAGLAGLSYQAALLAFSQGKSREADSFLTQSIEANECVADCWYLRANASFATEGPAKAAEEFEQAIYAAPFSPRYYFFRAECLRRNGNTASAVGQFQQALRCRPSSADTELILFKIGMTRLEANADLIFKTELRDHLSHEPVAGDTLLLAAAEAISRREYAEAADDLRRAALVLPPRVFQSRVRDYVFQSQAQQPDISAVLKLTLPTTVAGQSAQRTARVLVDPATRSLGEADPAGW